MKIQYIGFIPFLSLYIWGVIMTYKHQKEEFDFTLWRACAVFGTMIIAIGGLLWGFGEIK